MKVLVTAASKYGATARIAEAIADVLREEGLDVTVTPPERVGSVDEYGAVILGSGVYAGRWLKPATELVERVGQSLTSRPVWLFSSGPIGDPPKPEEDPVDVASLLETTRAREHRIFSGRLVKKELRFADRAIATALRVPEGDFRDWDEIRSWATTVAVACKAES